MADKTLSLEVTLENGQFKVASKEVSAGVEAVGQKTSNVFDKIKTAAKGFIALQIVQLVYKFGKAALTASAQMEQMETSFTTMLGSAQKAKTLVADLQKYGAATPLQFEGLANATKTLLQFGIEGDNVVNTLKMLGDVSGGDQAKLDSLALAFGQMSSTGRLMGQDLLQMINAGFNPLQEISEKTGVSMGVLKDKMSKGQISVKDVTEAFKSATSEGGKFYKMLEKQSQTLAGRFSTMRDNMQMLLIAIGNDLAPAFKRLMEAFSVGSQGSSLFAKSLRFTAIVLGKVVDTITLMVSSIQWLTNTVGEYYTKIQKYMLLSASGYTSVEDFLLGASEQKAEKMRKLIADEKRYVSEGIQIKNNLANTVQALTSLEEKQNKAVEDSIQLRKKATEIEQGGKKSKAQQEFDENVRLMNEYYELKWTKQEENLIKEANDHARAAATYQQYLLTKAGLDQTYISGLQTLTATSSIYMAQENKKLFKFGQILAVGQAWINTFLAVTKVMAQLGIYGLAAAPIIIAAGALQTKKIMSQKPPEFAVGSYDVPYTGPAIVHKGETILNKPIAESVRRGDLSIGSNQQNRPIIVQVDGKTLFEINEGYRDNASQNMGATGSFNVGSAY